MAKIIPMTTKRLPKKRLRKGNLIIAAIVLAIFIILLVSLINFINYLRLDMVRAELGTIDTSMPCQVVVARSETVVYASAPGQFVNIISDGEKVKAGGVIGYMSSEGDSAESIPVSSEVGGLVFYDLDGWEEILTQDKLLSMDWQQVFAQMSGEEQPENDDATVTPENLGEGRKIARIVDNLADIYLCLEVEDSILPYLNEGRVDLRFAELPEGYTLRGSIDDYESLTANDRYILVRIGIEEPLLNELRYGSAEVVGETISGVMIPKSSLVTDEQGNSGVYIKDRKKLAFCEVEVVGEGEDAVIVEGISATDMVAANPTHAKVGQKVY